MEHDITRSVSGGGKPRKNLTVDLRRRLYALSDSRPQQESVPFGYANSAIRRRLFFPVLVRSQAHFD